MPTTAVRRRRFGTGGPWGTGLFVLSVATAVQGVAYIVPRQSALPPALVDLSVGVPIWAWGTLWVAAGTYGARKALQPPQRHRDVWPIVAVTAMWSLAYLVHWAVLAVTNGEVNRTWTAGVAWGALSAYIICMARCVNPPVRDPR